MKKILLFLIIALPSAFICPQNIISINGGPGYNIYNSENSLPVMGDENFNLYFNYGFAYQRNDIFGLDLVIEYSYNNSREENTITFTRTSADSPEPLDFFGAHVTLINHNIDLSYVSGINSFLSWGAGPSFVITNRIVETDDIFIDSEKTEGLYDKLASSGIGANAFISASLPLSADNNLFAFSKLKVRYTHSVWFDEGLRKLDDYNQDFVTGEITIGIGYSF